jgi:hypothetical protein
MTKEEAMKIVFEILEKNQGLTSGEIVNKWFAPPVRPSKKREFVENAILELEQNGEIFFECEKPSLKTFANDGTPHRFYTKTVRSKNSYV